MEALERPLHDATTDRKVQRRPELTQQILDFGRKSIVERRPMDLLRFLRQFERPVGRTLPEPIGVRIEAADSERIVNADPGRMKQALLNLTLNARHALPEGGMITFRLSRPQVREDIPPYPDMRPGSWIRLSVGDTGTGRAAEILPHIFVPLNATKPVGEGTSRPFAGVRHRQAARRLHRRAELARPGHALLIYFPVTSACGGRPSPDSQLGAHRPPA